MKISLEVLKGRFEQEERTSELEGRSVEMTQSKEEEGKTKD